MISGTCSIEGVKVQRFDVIEDDRGAIHHMMKYSMWGEVYFSTVNRDAVKAWHYHKEMILNYACIYGSIMVGLVDLRPESPTLGNTESIFLDDCKLYGLITIPPRVWNGFRLTPGCGGTKAILANCASMKHHPNEIIRVHPDDFPIGFEWGDYEIAG